MYAILLHCRLGIVNRNVLYSVKQGLSSGPKSTNTGNGIKDRVTNYIRKSKNAPIGNHGEFTTIYKYKYIRAIGFLSRFKVCQTAFVFVLCGTMWMEKATRTDFSTQNAIFVTSGAVLSIVVLFLIAHYSRRLIGIAWLDKSRSNVKIAHLTFWGGRRDVVYPLSSLSEIGDFKQDLSNLFLKTKIRDSSEYYYFSLRGARVYDSDGFIRVFGMPCYRLHKMYNAVGRK